MSVLCQIHCTSHAQTCIPSGAQMPQQRREEGSLVVMEQPCNPASDDLVDHNGHGTKCDWCRLPLHCVLISLHMTKGSGLVLIFYSLLKKQTIMHQLLSSTQVQQTVLRIKYCWTTIQYNAMYSVDNVQDSLWAWATQLS